LPLAYLGMAGLAIVTAVGTVERSAILGLAVLGLYMWVRAKNKFGFTIVMAIGAALAIYSASHGSGTGRISNIGPNVTDSSALVRLGVWRWTLEFVATHPFGGGFATYIIDHVEVPAAGDQPAHTEFGRAFHSSYFEVLGEQGYPGFLIFMTIAGSMFLRLRRIAKKARTYPELLWVAELSDALQSGIAVFMSSGAFVGIAFQPMFWYFIAMGISLNAYMVRVEQQDAPARQGWRAAIKKPSFAGLPDKTPDWKKRPVPASLAPRRSPR
jgi:O-antigen ligase